MKSSTRHPAPIRSATGHGLRLLLLAAMTPGALNAQTRISRDLPEGVRVIADLVYARYGDRELKLDLYLPEASSVKTPHPVVVIRGGGWRQGDKAGFGPMAAALARRGIPAASIEYRASGEATFPAAVYDTKAAVRWLRENGAVYGLEPERIGAIGGSAGAHLAAYLGVTGGIPELEGNGGSQDRSSRVQAVVALATPADLAPNRTEQGTEATRPAQVSGPEAFLGVAYSADPEKWAFASPIDHVDAESAPILLVHSEDDGTVNPGQSLRLADRYAAAGVPFELVMFPGAPHGFWNFMEWFDDTMDRAAAFLLRHLGTD